MLNPEKESLSLVENTDHQIISVRIGNPQLFGCKNLRWLVKHQISSLEKREIIIRSGWENVLISQKALSDIKGLPKNARAKALKDIASMMYGADEITIRASNSPKKDLSLNSGTKQGGQSRGEMDSVLPTFTIRKPTAQELIQIIQNWQENNGKWITFLYKEGGEKHCVTLTAKKQVEILANTKALDPFAKIPTEVIVHKST